MYITISPQKIGPAFSSSVADFVDYLEKENTDRLPDAQEYFFNQTQEKITRDQVIKEIDGNTAKLKTTEPRYYSLTINPSQKELQHIKNDPEKLKAYTREVMKDYAASFNREINGRPVQVSDIKYYAKMEFSRTFKERDKEVRENAPFNNKIAQLKNELRKVQRGEIPGHPHNIRKEILSLQREAPHKIEGKLIDEGTPKQGNQTHLHLIVSRKDQSNTVSLSPGSKYKASEVSLHGKIVKRGFDRDRFFEKAEKTFDQKFNYKRNFVEQYNARKTYLQSPQKYYSMILKLPTNERKAAMGILNTGVSKIPDARIRFAVKQFQKAIELGLKSSSIGY